MKRMVPVAGLAALAASAAGLLYGQLGMFSKEQRIEFTREWKGERFPDGRPKVSDEVLNRLKTTTAEEAWSVLRAERYFNQFEGGWQVVNPGAERMVGRVVTAVFLPARPDVNAVIDEYGKKEGRVGRGQNSWVIDTLVPGDVLVVDLFGKIKDGTFAGDNLATSIFTKSKNGLVVNGGIRDVSGISEIQGFRAYVRGIDPSAIAGVTMMGINVPIRIGEATVMPGDVVVSDPEGLTFIPAHLAEKVADSSELTQLRDKWGHQMLRSGKYTPGEIDGRWSKEMVAEFNRWAEQQGSKLRVRE
ncbi:MAG: RraA family protein [Bryobacteraceae bacterium]|nr:RraA family protein [Bryobacterales bacterium]NUN02729.1 RraA family protein [Bryobacteraceae bacterium]